MYCIKCGVQLADTEQKCPLCNTAVCHPDFRNLAEQPLYPSGKMPKHTAGSKVRNGAMIILFLIPLFVCLAADLHMDGRMDWIGYVAGALLLSYIVFALPMWFRRPNPVVFVPCDFAAIALYLLYIELATGGDWFLQFALPVTAGLGLITCTVVTLLHYLRKGKLYVIGGAMMALGAFVPLVECLLDMTFRLRFVGWSVYPLCVLLLFGGLCIYLAINNIARETMERKLFF